MDISLLLNQAWIGVEEGSKFLPFALSAAVLLRLAHFPDIGIEGTVLVGGCSMALVDLYGIPAAAAFSIALCMGALGGCLTGLLYVIFQLNSLICGLITSLILYSLSFWLLGSSSQGTVSVILSEEHLALFAIIMVLVLVVFFSTRYGLPFRIAAESPGLLKQIGLDPGRRLVLLLVLGNTLAAASGALMVSVTGSVNVRLGASKLFLALETLILGEGVLSVAIAILLAVVKITHWFAGEATDTPSYRGIAYCLSGTGSAFYLVAAMVGSYVYWVVYNVSIYLFPANDFTPLVLALTIGGSLILINQLASRYRFITKWRFQ